MRGDGGGHSYYCIRCQVMKIGILTFHSQLNYGGVLQCWALQTALEQMGHEVVVIDRWLSKTNRALECGYNQFNLKPWVKLLVGTILGTGEFGMWVRHLRTKQFLSKYLKRTRYHFCNWGEAPNSLGVDRLVVGSDQIWHSGEWGDPGVYLLEGRQRYASFPRTIAYAASFGMMSIPDQMAERYSNGFNRFAAISCREHEGVALCAKLGFNALHVADPTLLICAQEWYKLIDVTHMKSKGRVLFCYLIGIDVQEFIPVLSDFAEEKGCEVRVMVKEDFRRGIPFNFKRLRANMLGANIKKYKNVSICYTHGPKEFVQEIATATWFVTDSFHGLMFSAIFNKNVRIIEPQNRDRENMFSRIREFVETYSEGSVLAKNLNIALESLSTGEEVRFDSAGIERKRQESMQWLREALG